MRPRSFLSLQLLVVLASFAVPSAAIAGPTPAAPRSSPGAELSAPAQLRKLVRERSSQGSRPEFSPSFRLESGNGYLVEVAGEGDNVVVYVLYGRHARSVTGYVARGTVSRHRLVASFGAFGKVSMRFKESSGPAKAGPNRDCRGSGRFEIRPGSWVGEFSFRGEGGYVSVQAQRAKGQITSVAPQCRRSSSASRVELATHPAQNGFFGPERPYLQSDWRHGVSTADFAALKDKKTIFLVSSEQAHGRFAILRLALQMATSPRALEVNNALTSARVAPPAPFSGVGDYRAAPDGTVSWSGSLSVNFPGAPHYPLTGPPFETTIGMTSDPFFPFF